MQNIDESMPLIDIKNSIINLYAKHSSTLTNIITTLNKIEGIFNSSLEDKIRE